MFKLLSQNQGHETTTFMMRAVSFANLSSEQTLNATQMVSVKRLKDDRLYIGFAILEASADMAEQDESDCYTFEEFQEIERRGLGEVLGASKEETRVSEDPPDREQPSEQKESEASDDTSIREEEHEDEERFQEMQGELSAILIRPRMPVPRTQWGRFVGALIGLLVELRFMDAWRALTWKEKGC